MTLSQQFNGLSSTSSSFTIRERHCESDIAKSVDGAIHIMQYQTLKNVGYISQLLWFRSVNTSLFNLLGKFCANWTRSNTTTDELLLLPKWRLCTSHTMIRGRPSCRVEVVVQAGHTHTECTTESHDHLLASGQTCPGQFFGLLREETGFSAHSH